MYTHAQTFAVSPLYKQILFLHAHLLLDKLCGNFRGLRKFTPSYAVLLLCNQQTALIKILRNKNNYT